MAKSQIVEDTLASISAVDWQALQPPAQRALFAGLTRVLLAMMKADTTPVGKRRTNEDRARRTADSEDKLALILAACASLHYEAMDETQLREAFNVLQGGASVVEMILQTRV